MGYNKRSMIEQITQLRADGLTFTEIAKRMGPSRQTVQRIAAQFGIQPRKWARVKMPTLVVASNGCSDEHIGGKVSPEES